MNGSLYNNPTFPNNDDNDLISNQTTNNLQNNVLDLLNQNIGKKIKVFFSSFQDKVFDGIIEFIGKDFFVIKNPEKQTWYLIKIASLDYIEFEEKINYF